MSLQATLKGEYAIWDVVRGGGIRISGFRFKRSGRWPVMPKSEEPFDETLSLAQFKAKYGIRKLKTWRPPLVRTLS